MRNSFLIFLSFFLMCSVSLFAQQDVVTGIVIDASDNSELIGVLVNVKGTSVSAVTGNDGKYTIAAKSGDVLIFSYVGMEPMEVAVKNNKTIDVKLQAKSELDEIVVIGYGHVKKRDLTGAVGSLNTKDVLKTNPVSINQALQGRIAGVNVIQTDGAPGSAISIEVRGANSFTSNTEPLFVIDGVPFEAPMKAPGGGGGRPANAMSFLNPQDIESLEVLKDASATALYGSRGANGVVLITTKRGKMGQDQIQVSANYTISQFRNNVEFLDGHDYAVYANERRRNHQTYEGYVYYGPEFGGQWVWDKVKGNYTYNPSPQDFKDGYMNGGTKWLDEIVQQNFSQEYTLNYSGASEKGDHYVSGSLLDQQGTLYGTGYSRASLRANINRNVRSFMKVGTNINFTTSKTNFAVANWESDNIIRDALYYAPTAPVFDPITMDPNSDRYEFGTNPYLGVRELQDHTTGKNITLSAYMLIDFTKNLQLKQTFGYGYNYSEREAYYTRKTRAGYQNNGEGSQSDYWNDNISSETLLTFNKKFNENHSLNAIGAFTYEEFNYGNKGMRATDFPNDFLLMYNMGTSMNPLTKELWSGRGRSNIMSYLARVNYTLKDRYLFTVSGRLDGSSRFATGNKYADFYSFALAWRASEEEFIKRLNIFSMLKPRFSFGQTGNQSIPNYQTQEVLAPSHVAIGSTILPGYAEDPWKGPLNKNLLWETTDQTNIGLDMGFFNNRLNFTADLYYKKTTDLLQFVVLPPSSGYQRIMNNSGYVVNKGLELSLQAQILAKTPVKWDVNANISWNRNSIGGLEGDQYALGLYYGLDQVFLQRNGHPIGTIFGYKSEGFYDNEAEVRADPANQRPDMTDAGRLALIGEEKYKDLDGDGSITTLDRTIIGDASPDYQFGITNNFNWKNLTFSFFIQGSMGADIVNLNLYRNVSMLRWGNIPKFAFEGRWTPDRTTEASFPKPSNTYNRVFKFTDRFVEDASYIKLRNINLGYNFRNPVPFISNIQLFANASNLWTWTKYRWFDPDVNSFGSDASRRGVDYTTYPTHISVALGARVTF